MDRCAGGGANQSTRSNTSGPLLNHSLCARRELRFCTYRACLARGTLWALPIGGASGRAQGQRREAGLALSCLFPSASCGLPVSVSTIPATILRRCRQCQTAESSLQIFQLSQNPSHTSLPLRRHCQQLAGSPALRAGSQAHGPPSSEAWLSARQGSSSVFLNCPLAPSARGMVAASHCLCSTFYPSGTYLAALGLTAISIKFSLSLLLVTD